MISPHLDEPIGDEARASSSKKSLDDLVGERVPPLLADSELFRESACS